MHQLFMPVAVSQFHVISNGIGKALVFFRVFFFQCFVDYDLNIFSQVIELGIFFWIAAMVQALLLMFPLLG